MMLSLNCGGKLLITSIRTLPLIFFAAMVGAAPPFGKVFYGVLVTLYVTAFLITVISILIMHLVNQDPNQTKGKFDLISK
jgi:hypothetical protein